MTPEYRSELRGKRRGFLEIWTRLGAEIRQIDEVLGASPDGDRADGPSDLSRCASQPQALIPLRGRIA